MWKALKSGSVLVSGLAHLLRTELYVRTFTHRRERKREKGTRHLIMSMKNQMPAACYMFYSFNIKQIKSQPSHFGRKNFHFVDPMALNWGTITTKTQRTHAYTFEPAHTFSINIVRPKMKCAIVKIMCKFTRFNLKWNHILWMLYHVFSLRTHTHARAHTANNFYLYLHADLHFSAHGIYKFVAKYHARCSQTRTLVKSFLFIRIFIHSL